MPEGQAPSSASRGPWSLGDRARAWLALLRLPNLFTVPGDIVAGWFLAGGSSVRAGTAVLLGGASLCIYSAGLVLNDLADAETDRRERPGRPIPSGRVSRRAAVFATLVLAVAGLGLAAAAGMTSLCVAGALVALVVSYDLGAKRVPVLGALVMGSCRGANVVLGASTGLGAGAIILPVALAASAEAAYVASVTAIAAGEVEGPPGPALRWLPSAVIAAGIGLVLAFVWGGETCVLAAAALPLVAVLSASLRLRRDIDTQEVQRLVGSMIGALVFLQAAFVVVASPQAFVPATAVLALWPLGLIARRYFHAS